jgi:hypothetical protein
MRLFYFTIFGAGLIGTSSQPPPPSYQPCHSPYKTPFSVSLETPCYDSLHASPALGYEVRSYPATQPQHVRGVSMVQANLTGRVPTLSEAVLNGATFILCYFEGACNSAHQTIYDSRTVPLLVQPPRTAAFADNWLITMALAPSQWPPGSTIPPGENDLQVLPFLSPSLVVAQHCLAAGPPGPLQSDFDSCLTLLQTHKKSLLKAGFDIDLNGPYSPTYAYFTGQNATEPPYDFEVWLSVKKV